MNETCFNQIPTLLYKQEWSLLKVVTLDLFCKGYVHCYFAYISNTSKACWSIHQKQKKALKSYCHQQTMPCPRSYCWDNKPILLLLLRFPSFMQKKREFLCVCTLLATVEDWRRVADQVHWETMVVAVRPMETLPGENDQMLHCVHL